MKRNLALKLNLFEKLTVALDEEAELFIQERPFLIDRNYSNEILDLSEQREVVEAKVNGILKEFNKQK